MTERLIDSSHPVFALHIKASLFRSLISKATDHLNSSNSDRAEPLDNQAQHIITNAPNFLRQSRIITSTINHHVSNHQHSTYSITPIQHTNASNATHLLHPIYHTADRAERCAPQAPPALAHPRHYSNSIALASCSRPQTTLSLQYYLSSRLEHPVVFNFSTELHPALFHLSLTHHYTVQPQATISKLDVNDADISPIFDNH